MLIFDGFPSVARAEAFVAEVGREFEREGRVFTSVHEAQAADPFPFELTPPVVHVERVFGDEDVGRDWSAIELVAIEDRIRVMGESFGGAFAGT